MKCTRYYCRQPGNKPYTSLEEIDIYSPCSATHTLTRFFYKCDGATGSATTLLEPPITARVLPVRELDEASLETEKKITRKV